MFESDETFDFKKLTSITRSFVHVGAKLRTSELVKGIAHYKLARKGEGIAMNHIPHVGRSMDISCFYA